MQPTAHLAQEFIDLIWNQQRFDYLPRLLYPDFEDHSLPTALPPTAVGLQAWVQGTSRSFTHQTSIDEQVTEGSKTMMKIRMILTHIGDFRGIAATGRTIEAIGYRYLHVQDNQIIGHWALLDGNAIETQLTASAHGCKTQR